MVQKSQTTTWDVQNPVNNAENHQPQLVQDFLPSTVAPENAWLEDYFPVGMLSWQVLS